MVKPYGHAFCHGGGGMLLSSWCSEVSGRGYAMGELGGGGGKKWGIVNELHGLRLVLQLYLAGLPLPGPPLHLYNPTAATCDLGE